MNQTTFLIVDDDDLLQSLLCRGLDRHGFNCIRTANIDGVREHLAQQSIDYAIVDLKLGTESGLSIIDEIFAQQPHCRILMLTGYASIATAVEAVKRGAFQYLSKPASVSDILLALELTAESLSILKSEPVEAAIDITLSESVDRVEWEHIQKVLMQEGGNVSATARRLGMHRRTLQRKLFKYPPKN